MFPSPLYVLPPLDFSRGQIQRLYKKQASLTACVYDVTEWADGVIKSDWRIPSLDPLG